MREMISQQVGGGGGKGGVTFNVQIREVLKRTIVNSSN